MKQVLFKTVLLTLSIAVLSFTEIAGKKPTGKKSLLYVIELEGNNQVPRVNTEARGVAIIRVTAERQLQSRIVIHRLDPGKDGQLVSAYLHAGSAGRNGGVLLTLASGPSDFGQDVVQNLTEAQYEALLYDALYINAYSTLRPNGLVRGQVR